MANKKAKAMVLFFVLSGACAGGKPEPLQALQEAGMDMDVVVETMPMDTLRTVNVSGIGATRITALWSADHQILFDRKGQESGRTPYSVPQAAFLPIDASDVSIGLDCRAGVQRSNKLLPWVPAEELLEKPEAGLAIGVSLDATGAVDCRVHVFVLCPDERAVWALCGFHIRYSPTGFVQEGSVALAIEGQMVDTNGVVPDTQDYYHRDGALRVFDTFAFRLQRVAVP